jgi:hypothetical protein
MGYEQLRRRKHTRYSDLTTAAADEAREMKAIALHGLRGARDGRRLEAHLAAEPDAHRFQQLVPVADGNQRR